ncbi:hypothetical protein [Synechocystis sp. PCC 7509]|uniref:hypothetical protein n=1 Tax=Synechocystis sp. PCC 7509 TaxID=927677 RepID=UPI0002ABE2F3|nr:hypothetical protein [Synechocystis sp. PCC 7509]
MVRKRIGDMLREEVKEPVAREDAPVTAETSNQTEPENGEVSEQLQPVNIPATKSKSSTELETTIDELKKQLQAAHKTETSLQTQITELKSQLQEQKKLVKELQTQVSQGQQLKTELEEAKKTILKLAEVSSKPTAKASPAKQETLARATSTRAEKLPNYSDPSERPNTTLGNKDIGWFD